MKLGFKAAALLGMLAAVSLSGAVSVGDPFPQLTPSGLSGGPLPVTTGKVVIVDFWASWCAPCKESFPSYSRLDADLAARGLVIVAIGVDQDPDAYASFVKKLHPPFFVGRDLDQRLVSQVVVPTMPTSYILDRQGRVRFMHAGFHGAETEALIRKELETLLDEKAS
jgi:thiol-disulfide isomerase/thioredoxin